MDDNFWGCLLLIAVVIGLWLAWPVGLWLIIALFCAGILNHFAESIEPTKSSATFGFWQSALPGLRDTAYSISVGLGIVTLAQIVFSTTGIFSSTTVKHWEEAVTKSQHQLSASMKTSVLLLSLGVLVLLSLLLPNMRLVSRFVKFRKWAGRVLLVLTTISSFTFFSSVAVSRNEPRWVAERRSEAKEAVDKIENGRRELVSLVWIQQSLKQLPPPMMREVRSFLETAATMPDAPDTVLPRAAEVLVLTAQPTPSEGQLKTTDSLQRVSAWLDSKGPTPTLLDVATVVQNASKTNDALTQAQTAAEEALKAIVGSVVPKSIDPLLRPFIKALSSALVKTSLSQLSTSDIADYNEAVAFARNKLNWSWRFPPANTNSQSSYSGGPPMPGNEFAPWLGSPDFHMPGWTPGGFGFQPPHFEPYRPYIPETVPRGVVP